MKDLDNLTSETLKLQFSYNNHHVKKVDTGIQLNLMQPIKIRRTGGEVRLAVHLQTGIDAKFSDGAPQKWTIMNLPNSNWTATTTYGTIESDHQYQLNNEVDGAVIKSLAYKATIVVNAPPAAANQAKSDDSVLVAFKLNLCASDANICFPKSFTVKVPVVHADDTTNNDNDGIECVERDIYVTIAKTNVHFT